MQVLDNKRASFGLSTLTGMAIGVRVAVNSSGLLTVAAATERGIGTLEKTPTDVNLRVPVVLFQGPGTVPMACSSAITLGSVVYASASGKIASTVNGIRIGVAVKMAASGTGSMIEVLPDPAPVSGMIALTGGQVFACGEVTLDGSNPTPIVTGLATVTAAGVSVKATTTPALDPHLFTVDYAGGVTAGTVNVYAWKPTGAGDVTMVASTNSARVLSWWAVGTL